MPVKIRLQRHGKKGAAFYHIVIADGRAPRNGKFIEKIGTYNPNTNPASIELNQDKALTWLKNGAQPTDTTRAILSYKGILYKFHLDKGVVKGALTAEQADVKLAKWLEEKDAKILGKISNLKDGKIDLHKKRIQDEIAKNAARAAAIAAKNTPVAAVVEAPEEVAFLKGMHRHLFGISLKIEVTHNDREIEFFVLQEQVDRMLDERYEFYEEVGSCEMIGDEILHYFESLYPKRKIEVEVDEDGENSAIINNY